MDPLLDPASYPVLGQLPYPPVFVTISGSHLYGFSSADSDVDLRGAHLAPLDRVLGLDAHEVTTQTQEIVNGHVDDVVTHEMYKFCRLAMRNSGFVLEQVMSPLVVIGSPWLDEMRSIFPRLANRAHTKHYLGFTSKQMSLLRRRPDKEVKIFLYIFRVCMTGMMFAETGIVEANILRLNERYKLPYIDDLVAEKIGGKEESALASRHDLAFYIGESERLLAHLEDLTKASGLPERTDPSVVRELDDFLIRIRTSGTSVHR